MHHPRRPRLAPLTLHLAAAAVIGPALAAPGCSRYRAPTFELVGVRELERTDDALVLGFTLAASNPNDENLPMRQADYRLIIDGVPAFNGMRSAETILRRYGKGQLIELPAIVPADRFDLSAFDSGSIRYLLTGSIEYQTPGELAEVLFDSGVRRPKAPLRAAGTLDLDAHAPPSPN